jgi:hypothetical protein
MGSLLSVIAVTVAANAPAALEGAAVKVRTERPPRSGGGSGASWPARTGWIYPVRSDEWSSSGTGRSAVRVSRWAGR